MLNVFFSDAGADHYVPSQYFPLPASGKFYLRLASLAFSPIFISHHLCAIHSPDDATIWSGLTQTCHISTPSRSPPRSKRLAQLSGRFEKRRGKNSSVQADTRFLRSICKMHIRASTNKKGHLIPPPMLHSNNKHLNILQRPSTHHHRLLARHLSKRIIPPIIPQPTQLQPPNPAIPDPTQRLPPAIQALPVIAEIPVPIARHLRE